MGNFRKLIHHLRREKMRLEKANSLPNIIQLSNINHTNCRATIAKAIAASRSLNKALSPTKAEIKKANQTRMKQFRLNLKDAVLNKAIPSIDIVKLEIQANKLSTALAAKGLI